MKTQIQVFERGTVLSPDEPMNDVHGCIDVSIASVTFLTRERLSVPIPLIGIATQGTGHAGLVRRDGPEDDTVVFTVHFDSLEPICPVPSTDVRANTSTQSPFEFRAVAKPLEVLNNHQIEAGRDVPRNLVHPLPQGADGSLLSPRSTLAAFDPLDHLFDLSSELFSGGEGSEGIDARVDPDDGPDFLLRTGLDLEGELDALLTDDVGIQPLPQGCESVEMLMPFDRDVQRNAFPNGCQMQPKIERVGGLLELPDGAGETHLFPVVPRFPRHHHLQAHLLGLDLATEGVNEPSSLPIDWLNLCDSPFRDSDGISELIPVGFEAPPSRENHIDGFPGANLPHPVGEPGVGLVDDGSEKFELGGGLLPEHLDKDIAKTCIFLQHITESPPLRGGRELRRALGRTSEFHRSVPIRGKSGKDLPENLIRQTSLDPICP